jgi:hypothetical protein
MQDLKVYRFFHLFCWTIVSLITYRHRASSTTLYDKAMTHVPKYSRKPLQMPKSAHGFVWRIQMLDNRIANASDNRSRVIYQLAKSVTFVQAVRLGEDRFEKICSRLGITCCALDMERHEKIAAEQYKLARIAEHLPSDEEALAIVAEIGSDTMYMGGLLFHRIINPRVSLDALRHIARYSRAANAFDELRRAGNDLNR